MNKPHDLHGYSQRRPPSAALRAWTWMLGRIGRIAVAETEVARRGFVVRRPQAVARLEEIGRQFVRGYNLAVGSCDLALLAPQLAAAPADDAGFCYEGAAMGITIADWLTPGRGLFQAYIAGPARHHEYMAWVGMGWALARLPVRPERALARQRNLHCWLALDGYGFHEGYFHWQDRIAARRLPGGLSADGQHVFDQGLGRSLWFVYGAEPEAVARAIASFEPKRHADLWAGAGLAAAYAGGSDADGLDNLLVHAAVHASFLGQGVVFAAQARTRAGNCVPHVELACRHLLGMTTGEAAALALAARPAGHSLSDYQQWRFAIQRKLLKGEVSHVSASSEMDRIDTSGVARSGRPATR